MSNTIQLDFNVTDEFLDDILINAVETGYSNYWADIYEYKYAEPASAKIRDAERNIPKTHNLDRIFIFKGLENILMGKCKISDSIYNYILEGCKNNDAGNIDAECCDCILQSAMFGELVYG